MTTDGERLAAIRDSNAHWPVENEVFLLALVDRLTKDRKDYEQKWYSSNRSLHAAWEECGALRAQVVTLTKERDGAAGWSEDDKPLPEDEAIKAAFPTRTDKHELYAEAMRLVGAKRSKRALVALVNWLLFRIDVKQRVAEDRTKERDEARADHLDALADSEASSQTAIDAVAEVASLRARAAKLELVVAEAREILPTSRDICLHALEQALAALDEGEVGR